MWLYIPTSHFLREPADWTSPSDSLCQRLAQFATWKTKLLPLKSWRRELKKGRLMKRLSGLMCEPSQANYSVAAWLESLEDSHAQAIATEPRLEVGRRERGDDGIELATAERSGGTLEHSDRDGCEEIGRWAQVESAAGSGRDTDLGSTPVQSGTGLPLFAPGPSSADWEGVLVRRFWLRPAISQTEAESTLRHVADGLATMVVHERADALRAVGNGVVVVQGAAILRELLRRVK